MFFFFIGAFKFALFFFFLMRYCFFSKISVKEWNRFTSDIILAANQELVQARPIRSFFDKSFSKMLSDLVAQSNAVDRALRSRVEEYRRVIDKFKNHRTEVFGNNVFIGRIRIISWRVCYGIFR